MFFGFLQKFERKKAFLLNLLPNYFQTVKFCVILFQIFVKKCLFVRVVGVDKWQGLCISRKFAALSKD